MAKRKNKRGLASASKKTRTRVARMGGKARQEMLSWRNEQPPGSIMSRKTFNKIYNKAKKKYGKKRAKKIAGDAYWDAVRKQYNERR